MSNFISERQASSQKKIEQLKSSLSKSEALLKGKACVYLTGSFGRLEAGDHSDLDLFIVSKVKEDARNSMLSNLESIIVKAELITVAEKLKFPKFDADGRFLESHKVADLIEFLGSPRDDCENTLTGRLLLFLESRPLLGEEVYNEIIEEVIVKYFRDYASHSSEFMPAFLANDILRLWRTFCVNYEFARRGEEGKDKVKNYKLKHSRMMICFSALLYLLFVFRAKMTVSIEDAKAMTAMTPVQRLNWVSGQSSPNCSEVIGELLNIYSDFLLNTNLSKDDLINAFILHGQGWMEKADRFGDLMSTALQLAGGETRFYRLMTV